MVASRVARLLGVLVAVTAATATPGVCPRDAEAQVWRPKRTEKKKRPAPRPKARKPAPAPAPAPTEEPEAKTEAETEAPAAGARVAPEPAPAPAPTPTVAPAEPTAEPDADDGTTIRIEDDDSGGGDDGAVRIDDDLDDVGANVTFSDSDLASDATGKDTGTRLDTKGLAYGRLSVDSRQSAPPRVGDQRGIGEDVIQFRGHARAEGTGRFGERLKVKVAGRADAEIGLDADTEIGIERYEAELWDTYVDLYGDWLDLRFGKQLVTWGSADLLSPNDVINPRDLRRGIADRPDELRLPVLAAVATAFTGPLALQAVWVPVAPANRFDLLEGDFALLGPHGATATERRLGALVSALVDDPMLGLALGPIVDIGADPDAGLESGELGAHGSVTLRSFDAHAYFLWGHERTPRIRVDPALRVFFLQSGEGLTPEALAQQITALAQQGINPVIVDYPRRIHAGAAVATRIEPIGIKLDAAFTPQGNTLLVPPGAGPVLGAPDDLDQGQVTLSLDYDRGTELSTVLEVSHLRVFDVPRELDVFGMAHDHLTLVGASLSWNPQAGPFTLSFLGFVDVDSPSYAIKPAVKLSGHDHLSLEVAAAIFGGPEGTFGGLPDGADEVSITVQYGL